MLVVRQPKTENELQAGIRFYANCYMRRYGTYPSEHPQNLFVAHEEGDENGVVGSIGIRIGSPCRNFEVEEYFHCNLADLYQGPREEMGEIGRLASANRRVTPYLFSAAVIFAQQFNIKFFLSFNKSFVTEMFLKRLGFGAHVKLLDVKKGAVPREYASYFMDRADPVQMLYGRTQMLFERARYWQEQGKDSVRIEMPSSLNEGTAVAVDAASVAAAVSSA